MANKHLIDFIRESRMRGFDDYEIRRPLLEAGWPHDEVELAFISLKPKLTHKHRICTYVDADVLEALEKRAKKNKFTLDEQISDILRRSVVNSAPAGFKPEKLDDSLVGVFSRRTRKTIRK